MKIDIAKLVKNNISVCFIDACGEETPDLCCVASIDLEISRTRQVKDSRQLHKTLRTIIATITPQLHLDEINTVVEALYTASDDAVITRLLKD